MSASPLVSIITINYKQSGVTNALLQSLADVKAPSFEVLLVDNHSGPESIDQLDLHYDFVRLIRSPRNLGFAGGNNLGIQKAIGKYILLLNNDTEVAPDFLEHLIRVFDERPNAGAVSPKIKYYEQPDTIQYAGFTDMNPFTLRMRALGYQQIDDGSWDQLRTTPFAHGCAMMVPRRVIDHVGLMPEAYFLYYEEHDWSYRIRQAGYQIYVAPRSVVWHKESMSVQKDSPLKTYYLNRNRILYLRRNHQGLRKILASLYMIFVSIPKNLLAFGLFGDRQHWRAYCDALKWHLSPKMNDPWTP